MKAVSDHVLPKDRTDAFALFINERDYIAQSGHHKTTVAAMDWANAEIERLRAAVKAIQTATVEGRVCGDVAWFVHARRWL